MVANPLNKVRRNAGIAFGYFDMSKRPEIAISIAQCIAYWSEIELQIGILFSLMLKSNADIGVAMYHSLVSTSAQFAAFQAASDMVLDKDDKELFTIIFRIIKSLSAERNKLAHWLWGYSDQIPDGLLLLDPRYRLAGIAKVSTKRHRQEAVTHSDLTISRDEVMVYRNADFEKLKRDMVEGHSLLAQFSFLVCLQPPSARAKQRAAIYKMRLIQENKPRSPSGQKKSP